MFKRKSVLYTWCLSYGLLLLMMVVMCIMLGRNARNQLISEYKSITQTLQKQSNNAINDYFDELERCAYEISNDYLVNDFVSTPDPSGSKYYNLQPIQQSLSVYALQSGGEVSRYLYMDNIGRALSSDAIFRLHEFYASLGLEAAMSAGDFTTLLQDYHYNELYVFETGGKSEALMLTSVPLVGGTPKGTLVQVMNPETIAGMIQSNSAVEDSTTVLLDSDGSLLSATGDAAVAELLENADVSSAEDSEITLGGQLYWIQRERLPKAGWHLITVVPMSSIGAKSDWIIRRALPVMLAMVCMTAVLCLCFLYIQYKPLNRLRKELAGTAGHALSGNEYDQLLAAFTDAKSSRDQIQMLWENQRNELRQEFVQSCIEGDVVYDEKHLHQVLERLDAGFSGDWFGVVLLDAGGGAETLLDSGSEREALEDLLNHMAHGVRAYLLPRGRQWSILLNAATGSGIEQTVAELDALLKRAAREAGGDFLCAFSKPWRDFKNIHLAYLAANEALREQHEKAAGCQEQCGPTLQPAQVPRLSSEQEELLMRYIAAGNEEEAASVLQMILRHNWEEQELPVSMCRCLAYDLLCGILRCLGTMPEVWEQQREALRADLHLLRHAGTRDEIAQMLMATVLRSSAAYEGFHTVAGAAREQPMERIMQCVNEHYRDLDFNVSRAAEYLGMSVPYLSNLFKQQTGIGLLNYISGLRVNYAKQCILERHISVAQAAHEAGFENINTFIRIFKKYEGTTPGSINS